MAKSKKKKSKSSLDLQYQKRLVERLRDECPAYKSATGYTILLELVSGMGVKDVFMLLHNVATDLDKREDLESEFDKAKDWKWSR